MGQEPEAEERRQAFAGFRVTGSLLDGAAPDVIFMHCLPAHRGQEVAADVIDSPRSVVFAQARNRRYTEKALFAEAERRRQAGWMLVEEAPHGYRRAVASPAPLEIVEEPTIRALVDAGVVVIAVGGGGVPVVRRDGRIEGIEAVGDKEFASALLAMHLRVDVFAMSTDVDRMYLNFAHPDARGLGQVTADELRRFAADGHFPAGTMGPKVEAALQFIAAGGAEVIVTSPERLVAAIEGHDEGTRVVNAARAARRRGRALASTVLG